MKTTLFAFSIVTAVLLLLPGCTYSSQPSAPPDVFVTINDHEIEITKGTYEWETKGLFSDSHVFAEADTPYNISEHMEPQLVKPSSLAQVNFSDGSQPKLSAYLWDSEGKGKRIPLDSDRFRLPNEPGRHIIELFATWPNGNASYTFLIQIN